MNRRNFIQKTGGAMATGLLSSTSYSHMSSRQSTPRKRPNLVFVFPDQMRAAAQGFRNEDPVHTPNLDRFARQSVVLDQTASNYPVCSPYRAMLMTGQYPHSNGVLTNCNSASARYGYELKQDARCWSDVLKDSGYSLGYIGKWHLDSPFEPYVDWSNNEGERKWNEWCPPERRHGFDFWHSYGTYDQHMAPRYWTNGMERGETLDIFDWSPRHEADTAIDFIQNRNGQYRDADKPFALVVSMNPPHTPFEQVPDEYLQPYNGKSQKDLLNRPNVPFGTDSNTVKKARESARFYLGMVTGVDDQFGRIVDAIDAAGLGEDTIIVFTSDHGEMLGSQDRMSKNRIYEESINVPFMIRWPGQLSPRRDNLLLSSPDIYPTLLALMGLESQIPDEVEGISHAKLLKSGRGHRPEAQLVFRIPYGEPAHGVRGIRTERYSMQMELSVENGVTAIDLWDRQEDPYMMRNIAEGNPGLVRTLAEKHLFPELQRLGDPVEFAVLRAALQDKED